MLNIWNSEFENKYNNKFYYIKVEENKNKVIYVAALNKYIHHVVILPKREFYYSALLFLVNLALKRGEVIPKVAEKFNFC